MKTYYIVRTVKKFETRGGEKGERIGSWESEQVSPDCSGATAARIGGTGKRGDGQRCLRSFMYNLTLKKLQSLVCKRNAGKAKDEFDRRVTK